MQKQKVVAWLAQHNFPHGMVFFSDGLSTDPLRQKAGYLRGLIDQVWVDIIYLIFIKRTTKKDTHNPRETDTL